MGSIRDRANVTYRDGPASNPHEPQKDGEEGIRALFGVIEDAVQAAESGLVQVATLSELNSIAGTRIGQPARVLNDGGPPNDGEYSWTGSAWQRIGDLPEDIVNAEVVAARGGLPSLSDRLDAIAQDTDVDILNARRLYDDRGWPLFPRAGYQATPRHNPSGADIVRSSPVWTFDDRGLIQRTEPNTIAHDHDPVTGRYRGWLVEPPSSNTFLFSSDFAESYWQKLRATISPNAAIGLDGEMSCDVLYETTADASHLAGRTDDVSAGEVIPYTFVVSPIGDRGCWIVFDGAAGGGTGRFDLTGNGAVLSASAQFSNVRIQRVALDFYLIRFTYTVGSNSGPMRSWIAPTLNGEVNYPGQTNRGLRIWHAQRETAPYPTSLIKTSGSIVSRPMAGITRPIGDASEGTIFARFRLKDIPSGQQGMIAGVHAASQHRIHVGVSTGGLAMLSIGGVAGGYTFTGPAVSPGQEILLAASYRPGEQFMALNGQVYAPANPFTAEFDGADAIFSIGSRRGGGNQNPISAWPMDSFYYGKALSSDELRGLTILSSGGGGGEAPSYVPTLQRAEVAEDLSDSMTLAWGGPDSAARAIEFRVAGVSSWQSAGAVMREVPISENRMFFTTLRGLTPDTIYEWRPAGTGSAGIRKFRTLPDYRKGNLRIAFVADWQRPVVHATDPNSWFNQINNNIAADEADIVLIGGDLCSDDGDQSPGLTLRWEEFIRAWSTRWVDSDGCQIPFCAVAGNHESNPGTSGTGVYGYMDILFTTFYRPNTPNSNNRGYGHFTVGKELLCIGLETHHGTPLTEQIPWLENLLAEKASEYRHIVAFGHLGPMSHTISTWNITAHRLVRERVMPILQEYPNFRFYLHGHNHTLAATRRVKFMESPADNANAWSEDADGMRCLGAGGWHQPDYLPYNTQDEASDPELSDGSVLLEYLVASNQSPRNVTPISAPNSSTNDPATKHHWTVELREDDEVARARSLNRTTLIELTETVG